MPTGAALHMRYLSSMCTFITGCDRVNRMVDPSHVDSTSPITGFACSIGRLQRLCASWPPRAASGTDGHTWGHADASIFVASSGKCVASVVSGRRGEVRLREGFVYATWMHNNLTLRSRSLDRQNTVLTWT